MALLIFPIFLLFVACEMDYNFNVFTIQCNKNENRNLSVSMRTDGRVLSFEVREESPVGQEEKGSPYSGCVQRGWASKGESNG